MNGSVDAGVPVLSAQRLGKEYGARTAVRDVSFDIHAGQVLGVLGPNGAGKSTIVRIITGLLDPSRGGVLFRGVPVAEQFEPFRQSLGYVPEQADVYGFLTGWEYVEMICTLRGLDRRDYRQRALTLFDNFQLAEARNQPMGAYSKGMRQRVVLIAALIHNPAFLVLDEPFSGLDVTSILVFRRLIELLAARGKAIFFSSPSLEHLEQVSTHLLVLRSGSVVASGTKDEVRMKHGGASLTENFQQLADPSDTEAIARWIMEATIAGGS
ncbi:MAG TPA: ABC transporter ATP-binding protein [Bryobacteraceae bacterium]|nr:ABC transporter ATP-binding protein [Bryobacteraceae bacterium]